jgi:signal transduction histidine kinase
LSNAVKFTEENDEIKVEISKAESEEMLLISVKDTGIGIPQDKQEMIFGQFRQVDKSLNRDNEGSGVGLAIVKMLVELHEGEITVDSVYGEYTEFRVKLPAEKLSQEEKSGINYKADKHELLDRIEVEFSDVYDL